ncbi:MAG: hypothetical protein E7Z93_03360 [Cyanobacteria bacterium SIG32]|nr:hypothetical protein [Cyanobacteria bacterium SIG32]
MTSVNNVSFAGAAVTKNGNLYNKCKTGRRVGTVTGLLLGAGAASTKLGGMTILAAAAKICEKMPKANPYLIPIAGAIAVASVVATTLAGRALGALPDALVNRGRKKEADARGMNVQA